MRRLRWPVSLLSALLLAPGPGRSCLYCLNAPASPLIAPPPPEAPYDLRAQPSLSQGERVFLAGKGARPLGVYLERPGADPARHLLSVEAVLGFLKEGSAAAVAELRRAPLPLSQDALTEALRLYWDRGPLLTVEDKEFLARIAGPRLRRSPARAPPAGGRPPAQPVPASPTAAADPHAKLVADLRSRLVIVGNADERAAFDETFRQLARSETARGLMRDFIAEGRVVQVGFADYPDSRVITTNGEQTFSGLAGLTYTNMSPMQVTLNRHFVTTDPARVETAALLSHELLGHAFRQIQAEKKGLGAAYGLYINNETNARLVQWTVQAELGGKLKDWRTWQYLASPDDYQRAMIFGAEFYSQALSPADMADPVSVYRTRLASVEAELQALPQNKRNWESWRPIIRHFIDHAEHRMPEATFASLVGDIDNAVNVHIPYQERKLGDIRTYLQGRINHYLGQAGRNEAAALAAAGRDPFFAAQEAELTRLAKRLEGLAQGRSYETERVPPKGEMSWAALRKLYDDDRRARPHHWP